MAHGRRDLPWRNTRDAYRIYISEVMLQQTQVKTVLERYYQPFLDAFPTLETLAEAPREKVMKAWEGLGYYSRAANLHDAVKLITSPSPSRKRFPPSPSVRERVGVRVKSPTFPETVEALLTLPGIGRNTAHAIAAFAFRQPVPVMEANVRRVLCRIFAQKKAAEKILWEKAEILLNRDNPFDYNQAMMDLGSLVCTARAPRCGECPAGAICKGKTAPASYPAPKAKKPIPVRKRIIVIFENTRGEVYLTPRTTKFLGGLYGFPEYAPGAPIRFMGKIYDLGKARKLGEITQTYSHFRLEGAVVKFTVKSADTAQWHRINQLHKIALSRADSKIAALIKQSL